MPIEFSLLRNQPVPLASCPKCYATPFDPFMRGSVQRPKRWCYIGKKQDYCAIICPGRRSTTASASRFS